MDAVSVHSKLFWRPKTEIYGAVFVGFSSSPGGHLKFDLDIKRIEFPIYEVSLSGNGFSMIINSQPPDQRKENGWERALERIYWEAVFSGVNDISKKRERYFVPTDRLEKEPKTEPILHVATQRLLELHSEAEFNDFEELLRKHKRR